MAFSQARRRSVPQFASEITHCRLTYSLAGLAVGAGELNEEMSLQLVEKDKQIKELSAQIERLCSENNELRQRLGDSSDPAKLSDRPIHVMEE